MTAVRNQHCKSSALPRSKSDMLLCSPRLPGGDGSKLGNAFSYALRTCANPWTLWNLQSALKPQASPATTSYNLRLAIGPSRQVCCVSCQSPCNVPCTSTTPLGRRHRTRPRNSDITSPRGDPASGAWPCSWPLKAVAIIGTGNCSRSLRHGNTE